MRPETCNALALSHIVLEKTVQKGDLCVDATAGNGHDTAFLCERSGPGGQVLAFDIQAAAVEKTKELLYQQGLAADVYQESHHRLGDYVQKETAAAVVFNLGWLPGGDHDCFTKAQTTLPALETALTLLKPGGVLSICIYYGKNNGMEEKEAVLAWLSQVDARRYTAMVTQFVNRKKCPSIYACVFRNSDS